MDRLGEPGSIRETDLDGMGLRLIVPPLGALDLGAGLYDRDGLGAARFMLDGPADIRGEDDGLGAWLGELGRDAPPPEPPRPRG